DAEQATRAPPMASAPRPQGKKARQRKLQRAMAMVLLGSSPPQNELSISCQLRYAPSAVGAAGSIRQGKRARGATATHARGNTTIASPLGGPCRRRNLRTGSRSEQYFLAPLDCRR